ncbi:MAG: metal ABC transporter permease [Succinivibrio sp.]
MIESFVSMFEYPFMVRALIAGVMLSACAAVLGISLVLKHFSMMGDGLSHVAFATLAIAVVTKTSPLFVSLPLVMFTAFVLLCLGNASRVNHDAAIALTSTTALATGVMILSLTTGMNTDVCNYLFGSILGLKKSDLYISIIICSLILLFYVICYSKFFAITFDENFSKASGIRLTFWNMALALMSAAVIVLGMRMMGALLISNLLVLPALTSMQTFRSFKNVVLYAVAIAVVSFTAGLFISYHYSTPTGASVVLCNLTLFAVHLIIGRARR